jgi:alpha-D-ribose 1-methylphosphonate 5-triphosphate synthase subunit PhnH
LKLKFLKSEMLNKIMQLPGFRDPVHDAQETFLALLNANSRPGIIIKIINSVAANVTPESGLTPATSAACLTLLDLEVKVWLQPCFDNKLKAWLLFHTGCCFTERCWQADFAIIGDLNTLPELSSFNNGTVEKPEDSTTLLIQVNSLEGGKTLHLSGPGILSKQEIAPQLPNDFWEQWDKRHQAYPLGVDVFLFSLDSVIGLPRTVQVER